MEFIWNHQLQFDCQRDESLAIGIDGRGIAVPYITGLGGRWRLHCNATLVQCYTVLYSYVPIYTTTKWLSTNALSSSLVSHKKRRPRLLQCFAVAVRNSGLGIRKFQLMRRGVVQRSLPPAMVVGQPISAPVPNPHSGAACGLGCLVPMLVGRVNAVIHWTVKVLKLIFIVKHGVFFETCWVTLLFSIFLGTKICLDIDLKP